MNTNTFLFNKETNSYWNPLKLASSPRLNKTPSYEELPIEDKVVRLENSFINLQNSLPNTDECKKVFFECIDYYVKNNSTEDNVDFYNESPYFYENNKLHDMMKTLAWLTYTDEMKTKILDEELDNYFA